MSDTSITWDAEGSRVWETGVDRGVLYPNKSSQTGESYSGGVAWNGLTSVTETPSGSESNDMYADNIVYASIRSASKFGGTIEAYTYPDEFAKCNGEKGGDTLRGLYVGQQKRTRFGFSYRSDVGNDLNDNIDVDSDYKLHLWYNCAAAPSERQYSTINDSPEAITMSWEISTIPVKLTTAGYAPTALIVIDSSLLDTTGKTNLATLEAKLYDDKVLPTPDEVIKIMTKTT